MGLVYTTGSIVRRRAYDDGRFDPAGHESSRKIGGRLYSTTPQSKSQLMSSPESRAPTVLPIYTLAADTTVQQRE